MHADHALHLHAIVSAEAFSICAECSLKMERGEECKQMLGVVVRGFVMACPSMQMKVLRLP